MGSPLTQARVHFVDGSSAPIDLGPFLLRGIFSPAGHALGTITAETGLPRDVAPDAGSVAVALDLVDDDEGPTLIRVKDDWPLWITTFTVEHPRDTPFDLFLLVEHRG